MAHTVHPDSFSTDDGLSTDGASLGSFLKSISIDLILTVSTGFDPTVW